MPPPKTKMTPSARMPTCTQSTITPRWSTRSTDKALSAARTAGTTKRSTKVIFRNKPNSPGDSYQNQLHQRKTRFRIFHLSTSRKPQFNRANAPHRLRTTLPPTTTKSYTSLVAMMARKTIVSFEFSTQKKEQVQAYTRKDNCHQLFIHPWVFIHRECW